jgi:RsiW-degrading membrane proteinase PrsW (M82 family)
MSPTDNQPAAADPVLAAEQRIARREAKAAGLNPPLRPWRRFMYSLRFGLMILSFKILAPVLAVAYWTESQFVVAVAAAVTNAAVVLSWTWAVDHYEEEPWRLVAGTLLWGALPAIVLALIGEALIGNYGAYLLGAAPGRWFNVVVVAPIVEEICKGLVLIYLLHRHRHEFDGMVDGLLYGALVGIGFSMTENVLYYLAAPPEHLDATIFARGLVFGMNHAVFSACFGFGLGMARDSNDPVRWRIAPTLGLLAAIALHMAHNGLATNAKGLAIPLGIAAALLWFYLVARARRREAQWIRAGLAAELDAGVLTAKEIGEICSEKHRAKSLWTIVTSERKPGPAHHQRRFHAAATELAFARRKAELDPGDKRYRRRIAKFRQQMIDLRLHPPA